MTEQDWMACSSSSQMFAWMETINLTLLSQSKPPRFGERKFRLFAVACDAASDVANRADEYGLEGELIESHNVTSVARSWADTQKGGDPTPERKAAILHELFGNPFAPVTLPAGPKCGKCRGRGTVSPGAGGAVDRPDRPCPAKCRAGHLPGPWLTPQVLSLATAAYSGEWSALLPLSDALEELGCDSVNLLAHLRSPGPHAKGCWAVDLLLGKS